MSSGERAAGDMGMGVSDLQERKAGMPEAKEGRMLHTVRFEPVGVEMTVAEGGAVHDGAFRQGIAVVHGGKDGQDSSCKSFLREADDQMKKYWPFALPG